MRFIPFTYIIIILLISLSACDERYAKLSQSDLNEIISTSLDHPPVFQMLHKKEGDSLILFKENNDSIYISDVKSLKWKLKISTVPFRKDRFNIDDWPEISELAVIGSIKESANRTVELDIFFMRLGLMAHYNLKKNKGKWIVENLDWGFF